MRYRIDPQFWERLAASGMTGAELAERTPHGRQWVYRLHKHPSHTVSAIWVESVIAAFPVSQQAEVRSCFRLVSERYWIEPAFWGLLAVKRVKLARLALQVGTSQQHLQGLPSHPNYTLDGTIVDRICAVLEITERTLYFTPAIKRLRQRPVSYPLAS